MAHAKHALVLDIDSGSLGACIVDFSSQTAVRRIKRIQFGSGEVRDARAMLHALEEALAALLPEYAKEQPAAVAVILASPWFQATIRTIQSQSESPASVTRHSVQRAAAAHAKSLASGHAILESLPILVSANGYHTAVHHGLLARNLQITMYESVTDNSVLQSLRHAVEAVLPHTTVVFHTVPLVCAEVLPRITGTEFGLLIDVGAEVTDIALFSSRTLGTVGSLPYGSRTIARACGSNVADGMSRLSMFAHSELSSEEMQKVAAALETAAQPWREKFSELLAAAGAQIPVPHSGFIISEPDSISWFTHVIPDGAAMPYRLTPVTTDFLRPYISVTDGSTFDPSLSLSALFVHEQRSTATVLPGAPVLYSTL